MRCANCGAESGGDLTLCPSCGTNYGRRWQMRFRCRRCGQYVTHGVRVCPFCSASLKTKRHSAGLWLLGILASVALAYNVAMYGIGFDPKAVAGSWATTVSSAVAGWRERVSSTLESDFWERVMPLLSPRH